MDEDALKPGSAARRAANQTAKAEPPRQPSAARKEAAHAGVGIMEGVLSHHEPVEGRSRLNQWDEVAALVLKIVTVVALTFGLFEYDRQKADARVTQSLALVQEWEAGGYRDAYTRINDLLWPVYSQNADAIAAVGDDQDARKLLYGNIGETVTGKDDAFVSEADRDVDKIFQFFERAAICADQSICDYGVLRTFFGSESGSFWLYFSKYAERRRTDGYAGYGDWTGKFVMGDIRRAKFLGLL
jgi:hypothetical protein